MYDFTALTLRDMSPEDGRRTLAFLDAFPAHAANFMGFAAGELGQHAPQVAGTGLAARTLNRLSSDSVRNWLTLFNRSQEFITRRVLFDATFRARLRARGLDPNVLLRGENFMEDTMKAVGGKENLDLIIGASTYLALDHTFASKPLRSTTIGWLLESLTTGPIAPYIQIGYPFPRFNLVSAPRFIYDHSPAALADWAIMRGWRTIPLPGGRRIGGGVPTARGRLGRGLQASRGKEQLGGIRGARAESEVEMGQVIKDLFEASRDLKIRSKMLEQARKRFQTGGAGEPAKIEGPPLEQISEEVVAFHSDNFDAAKARVERLHAKRGGLVERFRDLSRLEDNARKNVAEGAQIGAPEDYPEWWARMATGTLGLLGLALIFRTSKGAEGTEYFQFRLDKNDELGTTALIDMRSFAPFIQHAFLADMMVDVIRNTRWENVIWPETIDEDITPENYQGIFDAMWSNYEGKYSSSDAAIQQFAEAFFSMSRAAGATLTLTDLVTQHGWPTPQDVQRATVASFGQLLARITVPGRPLKDLATLLDPDQALVTIPQPQERGLGIKEALQAPLANLPYGSDLSEYLGLGRIPPTISQTTGRPLTSFEPARRQATGINYQIQDPLTREFKSIGLPFSTWGVRRTGDVGVDARMAYELSEVYNQILPRVFESEAYQFRDTPALKRDFLQEVSLPNVGPLFPSLKQIAKTRTREALGDERVDAAFETPTEERRRQRQDRLYLRELREGSTETLPPSGPPGPPR
jgi:hypothetical protein